MDDPNRAFARGELEARACARPASPPLRRRLHVTTDPEAPAPACAATSRDTSDDGGREDYATGSRGGENGGGFFWEGGGLGWEFSRCEALLVIDVGRSSNRSFKKLLV